MRLNFANRGTKRALSQRLFSQVGAVILQQERVSSRRGTWGVSPGQQGVSLPGRGFCRAQPGVRLSLEGGGVDSAWIAPTQWPWGPETQGEESGGWARAVGGLCSPRALRPERNGQRSEHARKGNAALPTPGGQDTGQPTLPLIRRESWGSSGHGDCSSAPPPGRVHFLALTLAIRI